MRSLCAVRIHQVSDAKGRCGRKLGITGEIHVWEQTGHDRSERCTFDNHHHFICCSKNHQVVAVEKKKLTCKWRHIDSALHRATFDALVL
uniref:Uncharacterized protein n=1 Tax=Hyaloperonospora arabidopsidis (strain Emoy2) TaxID=559515 RepID=M4BXK6_HYAAE